MKRRLLYLTTMLLAFSAVGLTGCQQKDPEPGDVAGYDEGEEYLSIWVHSIEDTEEGQAYKESVDTFNEAYDGQYFADIEFVPRNDSGGGYSDKVNASVMAGGLPDVLTVDGPNISAYAANGIIQPLAELTEEEESEYLPSIIEQGTVNDELYALGVMESSVGLYYNKDILDEAGIEVPDADHPWTWSEFMNILEDLKPLMSEKDGYPLDMTFPVGESSIYYFAPFVWSGGGELVSDDGLTVDDQVEHITFSGTYANKVHQPVLYITERAVFELRPEGVTLIEIAPGIDLQTQVLDQMEFEPKIAYQPDGSIKLMDARIFRDELMGLAND